MGGFDGLGNGKVSCPEPTPAVVKKRKHLYLRKSMFEVRFTIIHMIDDDRSI